MTSLGGSSQHRRLRPWARISLEIVLWPTQSLGNGEVGLPFTAAFLDLLDHRCRRGMWHLVRARAVVFQPRRPQFPESGEPFVGCARTYGARLGRLLRAQAPVEDAADKKFSTKRRQTGIFMVVHPGSLGSGKMW